MFIKKAFTLTELLVSMSVLGLIATLTLPHIFMSMDRAKKRAVFKEAYHALQEAVQQATLEGGDTGDVIMKLNPAKICPNKAFEEGCTQHSAGVEITEPGVVLSSGATIFGLNKASFLTNGVVIGLENFPNKEYFFIIFNMGDQTYTVLNKEVSGSEASVGFPLDVPPGDFSIRSGEIKCIEQKCLDMFQD